MDTITIAKKVETVVKETKVAPHIAGGHLVCGSEGCNRSMLFRKMQEIPSDGGCDSHPFVGVDADCGYFIFECQNHHKNYLR